MKLVSFGALCLLGSSLAAPTSLQAQRVSAEVFISTGPVEGRVIIGGSSYRPSYHPSGILYPVPVVFVPRPYPRPAVVVVRFAPRVIVVERCHRRYGSVYWRHHGYRRITVYYDRRHNRYFDRRDGRIYGLREVAVYERRGRYFADRD